MAFKQSSNPLSRNTSPMRRSPFRQQQTMTMDELNKATTAAQEQSKVNSQSGTAGAPGDPGTEINYDDPRKFAGDDEGMLESNFEPQFPGDDGYEDQGMSRKESPLNVEGGKSAHTKSTSQKADFAWETHKQGSHHKLKLGQKTAKPSEEEIAAMSEENSKGVSRQDPKYFGLGKDDGTGRKIKKANKTAGQIVKMQNKRSSVKNVYLGDPDDLEGEEVRTADKPASKREVRKIKKFKKTKNQLGEKAVSPLNMHEGKKHTDSISSYQPIKDKNGKVILTSEQAKNIDEDHSEFDHKPSAADIKKAKIANEKMKMLKAKAKAAKAAKAAEAKPGVSRKASPLNDKDHASKKRSPRGARDHALKHAAGKGPEAKEKIYKDYKTAKGGTKIKKASPLNNEGHAEPGKAHSHYKTKKHPDGQVPKASPQGMKNKKNK